MAGCRVSVEESEENCNSGRLSIVYVSRVFINTKEGECECESNECYEKASVVVRFCCKHEGSQV
jgi:hypothetical protein